MDGEQIATINELKKEEGFDTLILAICCNWC